MNKKIEERIKTEKLIRDKMLEIREIYNEYNPKGRYLTLCIMADTIMFNNSYGKEDKNRPIDYFEKPIVEDDEND